VSRVETRPAAAERGSARIGDPQIVQLGVCSDDLPQTVRMYTEVFGFAEAGGRVLWGDRLSQIQALGDPEARFTMWWLVGRQDLFQLEIFQHARPAQKPLPADWRPSDLGWVRFGIAVPDFDGVLARLQAFGVRTLTEPAERDGLRRACFRDPAFGTIVEVMEDGEALPGGIRPRFYDLVPAVVYAAVSVADLDRARRFFVDTLGLAEEPGDVLHSPESEALWGLEGASRESFVVRAGDVLLEVVRYDDPPGRPKPDGYLLSDQGIMNAALGFREEAALHETFDRIEAGGYRANVPAPRGFGGTYVNDDQGTSLELLLAPREYDQTLGFVPSPVFYRPPLWPQPTVGPAA
jgi:catechol 2,3-dioxygenase-like lactoylglutathione lyase family enzyme